MRLVSIVFLTFAMAACASSTPDSSADDGSEAQDGATAAPAAPTGNRTFADGVFRSRRDPAMTVRVDPSFEYIGADEFVLAQKAAVERHHWVQAEEGVVKAMIVFQFEGFLPGALGRYRFTIPKGDRISGSSYRYSPAPVSLGDQAYVHNTWAFDIDKSAADKPEAESAHTLRRLQDKGLSLGGGLIMSRYARAVGPGQRKEIILFYIEPLSRSGHTIDDFPDLSKASEAFDKLSAEVVQRGRAAFEVLGASAKAP